MEMSLKDHAHAALPWGKDLPVPFGQELSEFGDEENRPSLPLLRFKPLPRFSRAEVMPIRLLTLYWQAFGSTVLKIYSYKGRYRNTRYIKIAQNLKDRNKKPIPFFLSYLFFYSHLLTLSHSLSHPSLLHVSVFHYFLRLS
jgi:hypothetical protein